MKDREENVPHPEQLEEEPITLGVASTDTRGGLFAGEMVGGDTPAGISRE